MLKLEKNKPQLLLTKQGKGYKQVKIELHWDPNTNPALDPFDLDASVLFLTQGDKFDFNEQQIVFYNNICNVVGGAAVDVLEGKSEAQIQQIVSDYIAKGSYCMTLGDEKKGIKKGADEIILLDLTKVPDKFVKLLISITIHDADKLNQYMGDVKGAKVVLIDESGTPFIEFILDQQFKNETGVVIAEFIRDDAGFSFKGTGEGFSGGLATLFKMYS